MRRDEMGDVSLPTLEPAIGGVCKTFLFIVYLFIYLLHSVD